MNFDKNVLGINVRYFRHKRGITQEELGENYYKKSWISKMENGNPPSEIDRTVLEVFAKRLGTTVNILIGQDEMFERKLGELDALIRSGDFSEETLKKSDELIAHTHRKYGPREQVIALLKRGNISYYSSLPEVALGYYKRAEEIARKNSDNRSISLCIHNQTYAYIAMNDLDTAESVLTDRSPAVEDPKLKATRLLLLVQLYCKRMKWEKAESAIQGVLAIPEISELTNEIMFCEHYMGVIRLNQFELNIDRREEVLLAAIKHSEIAYDLARIANHQIVQIFSLMVIGDSHLLRGDKSIAYSKLSVALQIASESHSKERAELKLLLSLCQEESMQSFKEGLSAITDLEVLKSEPRLLSKYYWRLARIAYKLRLIDYVNDLYEKALQHGLSIV